MPYLVRVLSPDRRLMMDAQDDDDDDDASGFLITIAATATIGIFYSWAYLWIYQQVQKQLVLLQQQRTVIKGTNTIDAIARSTLLLRASHASRRRSGTVFNSTAVAKMPLVSSVEPVELVVLPGFPKSGMERCEVGPRLLRVSRFIRNMKCFVFVCVIASPIFWVLRVRQAHIEDEMFMVYFMAGLTVCCILCLWLSKAYHQRTATSIILDPNEDQEHELLKVTITEIDKENHDPLLPPLPMSVQASERHPLLFGA